MAQILSDKLRGSATANISEEKDHFSPAAYGAGKRQEVCVREAYISVSSYLMKSDELDKNTLSLCRLLVTRRWPYTCTEGSYWSAGLTK